MTDIPLELVVSQQSEGYDRQLIMAIELKLRKVIEKGDWEVLEDDWLEHLDGKSVDLDYFVGVANYLASHGELDRAKSLLELVRDEVVHSSQWALHLELLIGAGSILHSAGKLHSELLSCLQRKFADQTSLEGLIEYVGLHRATDDTSKTIKKVGVLQSLLTYEEGSVVGMKGKGAGVVQQVNFELESFRILFDGQPPFMIRFKAAPKLMTAVPEEHFFYRKIKTPETLRKLGKDSPGDLLGALLSSFDTPRAAGQIRAMVSGLIDDSKWASWWNAARKHPQVLTSGKGGRQTYSWAESTGDAVEKVREEFDQAPPLRKLEIYHLNKGREESVQEHMTAELRVLGERLAATNPGASLEIWFALEKATALPTESASWSAQSLLEATGLPDKIISNLKKKPQRERAYQIVHEVRSDWPKVLERCLLRESDASLLQLLSDFLESGNPAGLESFFDLIVRQPTQYPAAFVWYSEQLSKTPSMQSRSPLRVLQQIMIVSRFDEFTPFRSRLLHLHEPGGPFPYLISKLDPEQAVPAEDAIGRAPLEEYLRDSLLNALRMKFSDLGKAVDDVMYALPQSISRHQAELQNILSSEIPANRRAIEEAREMGDLRENFEYKSARQRHEYLTSRAESLQSSLNKAVPIDLAAIDTDTVRVGVTLHLVDSAGAKNQLSLLGPWESDPDKKIISYQSELGRSLLSAKTGDEVKVFDGTYQIESIQAYSE